MTPLAMLAILMAAAAEPETAPRPAATEAGFTVALETRPQPSLPTRTRSERGPWLELDVGPTWLHHSGVRGLASGPQVRFALGTSLGERAAAELWVAGSLQSSAKAQLGDEGAAGGGLGARLLLHDFQTDGTLQLFARGGVGYMAATTSAGAPHGAAGFAGALILLKPPVKRFAFGLELDATAVGNAFGFALLPTLRCAL